jgi:hypothetical protein
MLLITSKQTGQKFSSTHRPPSMPSGAAASKSSGLEMCNELFSFCALDAVSDCIFLEFVGDEDASADGKEESDRALVLSMKEDVDDDGEELRKRDEVLAIPVQDVVPRADDSDMSASSLY